MLLIIKDFRVILVHHSTRFLLFLSFGCCSLMLLFSSLLLGSELFFLCDFSFFCLPRLPRTCDFWVALVGVPRPLVPESTDINCAPFGPVSTLPPSLSTSASCILATPSRAFRNNLLSLADRWRVLPFFMLLA